MVFYKDYCQVLFSIPLVVQYFSFSSKMLTVHQKISHTFRCINFVTCIYLCNLKPIRYIFWFMKGVGIIILLTFVTAFVLAEWIESVPYRACLHQSPNWFLIAFCPRRPRRADYSQFARWGGAINAAFEVLPAKVEPREGANTVRKQKFRVPGQFQHISRLP